MANHGCGDHSSSTQWHSQEFNFSILGGPSSRGCCCCDHHSHAWPNPVFSPSPAVITRGQSSGAHTGQMIVCWLPVSMTARNQRNQKRIWTGPPRNRRAAGTWTLPEFLFFLRTVRVTMQAQQLLNIPSMA